MTVKVTYLFYNLGPTSQSSVMENPLQNKYVKNLVAILTGIPIGMVSGYRFRTVYYSSF